MAMRYAQFGPALRFGNFRFGYTTPKVFVSVGGVQRAYGKDDESQKLDNLSITETRSSTPNKASFDAMGWEPTVGMEVIATMGSPNRILRRFAGTVLSVDETNAGQLRQFRVNCIDWNWLLDGEPIYGHFTGTADEIAIALMAYAPDGFTTHRVETGLPTVVGGITFTGVKLSAALHRLAKRASEPGAVVTQFIDYNKDLYFRVTPWTVLTNPTDIVAGLDTLKRFNVSRDLSQVVNRVPFEGGGSNALAEVSVGETILPLVDAADWWYGDVGGVVISGPQRISYTTRVAGGSGSLVGPGASPSSAPTLGLAAGSGVTTGTHTITVVFKTASGRSLPGPSASVVVGLVSAPSTAVTAGAPSSGGSMDAGSHRYYPVFRTGTGSTTAGPVSNAVTTFAEQANPPSGTIIGPGYGAGGSLTVGETYEWAYTYRRDSDGSETLKSGPIRNGNVSFSGTQTGVIDLTSASIAAPSGFTLVWYRSKDTGATYAKVNTFSYVTVGSNLQMRDGSSDGSLGSAPPVSNNTAKGTCQVTGIPVSPDALVTHVDMYREFNAAGASTAKLAFSVTNGTTSGSDTTANSGLGATVPSTNTAAAGQIAVSGIAIGGSGTTDRELYMSPAGGGGRKLALTIANNTATTGTITMSDATLASQLSEPATDTSGLAQPSGQVLPGASSLLVAGLAPFLSGGGWAFTGTQQIRYTGFTGSSLTGIPATGVGSIQQPISYNAAIAAAPCLTGIPASGEGSVQYTIRKGDAVNLFVTVEDTDAQAGLQTLTGADAPVVRECPPLQDRRVGRTEAITRATAFLTARAYPGVTVGPYRSKDMNNRAGLEVNINIAAPANVNDVFKIQSVTISNFTPNLPPNYTVTASDELFSIEDLLSKEHA